ncbi:YqcC family protein [Parasalinivibrio latis]|uniref:YqcC family protein n=1 Tax=Parasalinivibrio latis TaxID=2952610 RepID=UPI0030E1EE83
MDKYRHTARLLAEMTDVLKNHGEWQDKAPSAQSMASTEPFAIDSLSPIEWLQWIFIPRMQQLVDARLPLPETFDITPYFEEALKEQPCRGDLLKLTREIDLLYRVIH